MFPLMMPMLIGAAGGLLTNKKDPLKGALLGAGLGAAGGAIAPAVGGLFGSGTASTAAADAMADATFGATGYNTGLGQSPGLLETVKDGFKAAGEYAKPLGEAGMAAQAVGGLFGSGSQAPQPMQTHGDNGSLAQIAQADQQGLLAMQDADMKRRQQQMAMIQQMMGRG